MIRVSDAFGETEKWQRRAGAIAVLTAVTASGTFFSTAVAAPSDGDFRTAAVNAIHDRYLVVLKGESAGLAERKSNARKLLESYADAQLDYVYQSTVNGFSVQMPEEAARRLATDPAVDYVQQDASVTVTGDTLSSRPPPRPSRTRPAGTWTGSTSARGAGRQVQREQPHRPQQRQRHPDLRH